MRQRNDTDGPLTVHTNPPQTVEPGAVVEHDTPVIGLTVLDDPEPEPAEALPSALTKKSKEATR